jgi:uncharacterized membrane protein YkoI
MSKFKTLPQEEIMKKFAALLSLVLLASVPQAFASGLISRFQAEQDALIAIGGGTVNQAYREKEMGKVIWSVDITGSMAEYEVWVDAHSGAILRTISQPLSPQVANAPVITKAQAEQDALQAVGGGTVLSAHRDEYKGFRIWDVDISQPGMEYTVYVNAHSGGILKVIKQAQQAGMSYIAKARAKQIALKAVGGGTVLLARLDKTDTPPTWDVDVRATNGREYEVKVNAYTGKVLAIIPG